ncbi:hypothetical protein [Rhodococcus sp. MS13]|uniref:hypothetical protein n=1 Tax=Rhodococcus sp. MS13 TaxID=2579940 RepID=UPI001561B6FC|nr:hypothetical protein [Rhodococcus sp. MS13]NRH34299.1 hypothetical protein [Rhodococcus sp. MS13]
MTRPRRWTAAERKKLDADYHATVRRLVDLLPRRLDAVHLNRWIRRAAGAPAWTEDVLQAFLLAADPGNVEAGTGAVLVALSVDRITATTDDAGRPAGHQSRRVAERAIAELTRLGVLDDRTARTFVLAHNTPHGRPGVERRFAVSRAGVANRNTAVRRLLPDMAAGERAVWSSPGRMFAAIVGNGYRDDADAFLTQIAAWLRQRHRRDDADTRTGTRRHPPRPSGTRPVDDTEHTAELARVRAARNSRIQASNGVLDWCNYPPETADSCPPEMADTQRADQRQPRKLPARRYTPSGGVATSGPGSTGPGRATVDDSGAMVGIGGDALPDPRLRRWQAKNWRLLRQGVPLPDPATLDENGNPLPGSPPTPARTLTATRGPIPGPRATNAGCRCEWRGAAATRGPVPLVRQQSRVHHQRRMRRLPPPLARRPNHVRVLDVQTHIADRRPARLVDHLRQHAAVPHAVPGVRGRPIPQAG